MSLIASRQNDNNAIADYSDLLDELKRTFEFIDMDISGLTSPKMEFYFAPKTNNNYINIDIIADTNKGLYSNYEEILNTIFKYLYGIVNNSNDINISQNTSDSYSKVIGLLRKNFKKADIENYK